MWPTSFSFALKVMNMNKKFLKYYTSKKYIFLVDNQDIAIREEDFQPLEAGEKTPFGEHSEQLKLNI